MRPASDERDSEHSQNFSTVARHWQNSRLSNNYIMIMKFRPSIFHSVSGFNTSWSCLVNRVVCWGIARSYWSRPIYSHELKINMTPLPSSSLTLLRRKAIQTHVRETVLMSFRGARTGTWISLYFLEQNWTYSRHTLASAVSNTGVFN